MTRNNCFISAYVSYLVYVTDTVQCTIRLACNDKLANCDGRATNATDRTMIN